MKKKLFQYVSFIFYLIIVGFISTEFMLRTETMSPGYDLFGEELILDREFLFKFRGYSGPEINGDGYRDYEFLPRAEGRDLGLFLGDSFIMGLNVRSEQTIPKELERMLGDTDIYNMGAHGYGPDQSLIRLLGEGLELNPNLVILGLYPANDFSDIIKNHLFEIDAGGELVRTTSNPVTENIPALQVRYLVQYLRYKTMMRDKHSSTYKYVFSGDDSSGETFFDLFRTLFGDIVDYEFLLNPDSSSSREKISLMKAILGRYRDELGSRDISFLVVVIPSYNNIVDSGEFQKFNVPIDRYFAYENAAVNICSDLGIDCLNLYPLMSAEDRNSLFNDTDQHLTSVGTSFAAASIKRHMNRQPNH